MRKGVGWIGAGVVNGITDKMSYNLARDHTADVESRFEEVIETAIDHIRKQPDTQEGKRDRR